MIDVQVFQNQNRDNDLNSIAVTQQLVIIQIQLEDE